MMMLLSRCYEWWCDEQVSVVIMMWLCRRLIILRIAKQVYVYAWNSAIKRIKHGLHGPHNYCKTAVLNVKWAVSIMFNVLHSAPFHPAPPSFVRWSPRFRILYTFNWQLRTRVLRVQDLKRWFEELLVFCTFLNSCSTVLHYSTQVVE